MQVDSHVGTGSVQALRERDVLGGKKEADSGTRACFPHGQCVTIVGDRGQVAGVTEGT